MAVLRPCGDFLCHAVAVPREAMPLPCRRMSLPIIRCGASAWLRLTALRFSLAALLLGRACPRAALPLPVKAVLRFASPLLVDSLLCFAVPWPCPASPSLISSTPLHAMLRYAMAMPL